MSLDPYLNVPSNINSTNINATNNIETISSFLEKVKSFASKAFSELVKSFSSAQTSLSIKLNEAFSTLELKISKFVNSFFNRAENTQQHKHNQVESQPINKNIQDATSSQYTEVIRFSVQTFSVVKKEPVNGQQAIQPENKASKVQSNTENSEPVNLKNTQDKEKKVRIHETEANSETEKLSPLIDNDQMRTMEPLYTNFLVADAQPVKHEQPVVLDDYQESILSSALASHMLSELANEQQLPEQISQVKPNLNNLVANANQFVEGQPLELTEEHNESILGSVLASQIFDELINEQQLRIEEEQSNDNKTLINDESAKQQEPDQPSQTHKIRELEPECEKLIPNTDQEQIRKLEPKYEKLAPNVDEEQIRKLEPKYEKLTPNADEEQIRKLEPKYEKLTPNADEEQIRKLEPKYEKNFVAHAKQFEEGQQVALTEGYNESIQSSTIASQELEQLIKHEKKTEEAIKDLNNLYDSTLKNVSLFARFKASIPTFELTGVTYKINQTFTQLNPLTYLNFFNKSSESQISTIKETLVANAQPVVETTTVPLNVEEQKTQQSLANATDTLKELVKNTQDPELIKREKEEKYEKWVSEQVAKYQAELAASAKNQPGFLTRVYNYVTKSGESNTPIQRDELQDKILEETNLSKMFDETDPKELIQQQKIREEAIKDLNDLYNSTLKNVSLFARFKASIPTFKLTGVTYKINKTFTQLNPLTYLNFFNKSSKSQVSTIKETLVVNAQPVVEKTMVPLNAEEQNTQQSLANATDTLKELVRNAQDPELIKREKEEKYEKWVSEQVAKYQAELAASAKNQPNVVSKFYQSLKTLVKPKASIIRDTKQDKILEERTLDKLFGEAEYSKTLTEQITSTIKKVFIRANK